jgi:PXA domain-containing protein
MTGIAPVRAPTPRLMSQAPSRTTTVLSSHSPKQAPDGSGVNPGPAQAHRPGRSSIDHLSDKATAAFIRRALCAQQLGGEKARSSEASIDELLPPLTSRNDVDLQLYGFLAIILREFVQSWYNKITPDEAFVGEIVQIIAHCTRALEQRLRKVDLESLLFDELPDLLDGHITGKCPTV